MAFCKACHKQMAVAEVIGYNDLATYCSMACYSLEATRKKTESAGKSVQQLELEKTQAGSCTFLNVPETK